MGELDDLDAAGTGVADEPDDLGAPDPDPGTERDGPLATLDQAMEKLDLMDALDDLMAGGHGGFATGVEIIGESLVHSPYDDLLDAFEPARDMADHSDLLDDIF